MFHVPGFFGGEPTQPVPRDVVAAMMPGEPRLELDFWVRDADAAAAHAAELGGSVLMPPSDTGVGRTAVLADPPAPCSRSARWTSDLRSRAANVRLAT